MPSEENIRVSAANRWVGIVVALSLMFSLSAAQSRLSEAPRAVDERINSELIHWTEVLNRITLEAKTLQDETARPEALIAVADAFWDLDNRKSRELFYSALDLSLAVDSKRARESSLRRLLVAAAKRDVELSKDLVRRLQLNQKPAERGRFLTAAVDLVDIDLKAAEGLALAGTRNGPSFETSSLIFELHKKDSAAAARVYAAYLASVHPDDPSQLLWLAGYPFGFHEALGGSVEPSQLLGVFGLPNSGLSANRALAHAFLAIAMQTVDRILQQAPAMNPSQAEPYTALAYFILAYLSPQVDRYRPDLIPRWLSLQQSVGAGIDLRRRDEILKQVGTIFASREKAGTRTDDHKFASGDDLPLDVDKLPSCQRDLAYVRAALHAAYRSDSKQAFSLADKVGDLKMRSNVLQFVYFDVSLSAISPKAANLDHGLANAQRVEAPEQRGYLYLKLAEFAAKEDPDRARAILNELLKTSERIEDSAFRAALLFGVALNLVKLDVPLLETFPVMEKAIDLLNDRKEVKIDQISIQRRLDLTSCDGASPQWYGDFINVDAFNLIDALLQISETDAGIAEQLATGLPVGSNRIRCLAALATARIKKLRRSENVGK